ncbi:DUF2971 domain-containing protein [Actinomadura macra]|uniref:DUF2971 domain-containing protein n=1 Tax=Actinomadura macra TaxID=46164 RepID=UPI000A62B830|nr:DUF2971 domain-containing protein [Actinomadura macra]
MKDLNGFIPADLLGTDGYVGGVTDHEQILEQELRVAARVSSGLAYHYTGADTAIQGILLNGTLRLSPFSTTNDLWESRPFYPSVSADADDRGPGPGMLPLWQEIDRHIRVHAKVACLTQDVQVMDGGYASDALRGYAHLSLWAHYGARGAGLCLGFDLRKLVEGFMTAPHLLHTLRFHGPVQYRHASVTPVHSIRLGQITEFGVDAAALAFAEDNKEGVFFRKHADWANECEYRLVLIDQSVLPATVDIRSALSHVVLGECFPDHKRPALAAVLAEYPDVKVRQMRFHNRTVYCEQISLDDASLPSPGSAAATPGKPRRTGSLRERLSQLRTAEEDQRADAENAQQLVLGPLGQIAQAFFALKQLPPEGAKTWLNPGASAVPAHLRQRTAGVPGEIVRFEQGMTMIVADADDPFRVVVAAAAIQVLSDQHVRIHGHVKREEPDPSAGVTRIPVWSDSRDAQIDEATVVTERLLGELSHAFSHALPEFTKTCEAAAEAR